jgi:predicted NBD/HSP70 family sugar kinase
MTEQTAKGRPAIEGRARGARRGTNLPRVADYNQMLVLDLIRRSSGISRAELVQSTDLSAQTMSNITRRLTEANLIRETGKISSGSGAPRTIFEVESTGRYSVGLHIDPARLTFVVQDLAGEIVGEVLMTPPASTEPHQLLDAIETTIRRLLADASIDADTVAGLGVATPGPIDAKRGTVIDAPNLPGWAMVELRHELQARLGLPVVVEKDNTAAAVGEVWSSGQDGANFAFFYLGTGVAAGIVLDGQVMRGASSNIGDIGHLSADPNGPLCLCGGRGCLTATSMPANIVGEATMRGIIGSVDLGNAKAVEGALRELSLAAEESPDSPAAEILDHAARRFGRVAGQLANTLDLDSIIFGGPQWPALQSTFLRVVPSLVNTLFIGSPLHRVDVRGSSIGEHVGAVGAASLAMWETTFDAPKQLFLSS